MSDHSSNSLEQALQYGARLQDLLDNLNCHVNVVRPDTGEILFINRTMRRDFNLLDVDIQGKICWDFLGEAKGEPCSFCPCPKLLHRELAIAEWECTRYQTGRTYLCNSFLIEWIDGTQVCMNQNTDVTDTRLMLAAMEAQVARQRLLMRISLEAVKHTKQETLLPALLAPLAEYLGADRAFALSVIAKEAPLALIDEWCAPGVSSIRKLLPALSLMDLRETFSPPNSQAIMVFDSPETLPPELQSTVLSGQIHHLIALPVRVDGVLNNIFCFAQQQPAMTHDESDLSMLYTVCGIAASAIQRIRAELQREDTQHKLEAAILSAEHASSAKSDFLSRMSHEIRTPMNVIIGMCRIALHSADKDKIQHSLEQIDTSAKHLLGLINDILDVSKIEANKFELHSECFELEHMLMNVSNAVMMRAEERKQNVQILLSRGLPKRFVGDEMRLTQVVTNLFTNAIKFTPEGGNIVLSMRELSREGDRCVLEARVRDNGIGMSPQQISRLFTSFEQADGSIARKYGGTGLGLAICKSIVTMMNGDITVESEVGRGSTFIFTVELEVAADQAESDGDAKQLPAGMRMLVIDDEIAACEYFASIVQGFGIACDQALSGPQAIQMLERFNDYDFVFVDWQMAAMDGIATVHRIRPLLSKQTKIVMISSADLSQVKPDAIAAGVQYFVTKPLFSSDLYNLLASILGIDGQDLAAHQRRMTCVPDLSACHLLLAEDMEFNREVALAMLEETGCKADEAENGRMAVEMFARNPERYGCILMDMQMPEMDGLEATRAIRALDHPWAKKVPIVAMTANVFQDDIAQCLAVGMDDHIGKPIVDHTLYEKLAFYLHANATTEVKPEAPKEAPAVIDSAEGFLPFIGIEQGLARLRGNKKLFSTLLGSFQRNNKYADLCAEIASGQYAQAAASAHAIKGIAANIELCEVYRLIVAVEATLKSGVAPSPDVLAELENAYARTLELLPRSVAFLSRENA